MKKTLLTLNKPNLNGRIYRSHAVQDAVDRYIKSGKPILAERNLGTALPECDVENVVGDIVSLYIEGDTLVGEVRTFDKNIKLEEISCRPRFIGKVDQDGIVSDIELVSFGFTSDPA